MPRASTPPDLLSLARLVLRLSRALERNVDGTLRPTVGLSVTEYLVLRVIEDGAAYPSAVSAQLNLPPASVSRTLDRLEEEGLVRRSVDAADQRRFLLAVTEAGAEIAEHARSLLREQLREAYDHVPNTVLHSAIEELRTLLAAMEAREAR
jgi:DNA-binding MarR family transcriptional regulator